MARKWQVLPASLVLMAALAVVSAALAASQVKSGSYKGSLMPSNDGVLVSFKVSASGKQVTALTIANTPLYCSGGGRPTPVHFKNASISSKGAFSSTGKYVIREGPMKGKVGTTLKITGQFLKGRKERGTLTTKYTGAPKCGGQSPYSTKA
ncbi:MAG TPA: hypothetical protein VNX67_09275 [Solirubrobacteraceae bacterium]|jgi:hypothetical protein|nr:hypothetical protein [Solirubrobacteraceae bacterium]